MTILGRFKIGLLATALVMGATSAGAEPYGMNEQTKTELGHALAGEHRGEANMARDPYRNPFETLRFFGLNNDMTVLEVWPGGGWYTDVLAPTLAKEGKLYIGFPDPGNGERAQAALDRFKKKISDNESVYGNAEVNPIGPNATSPAPANSVDLVLTFRNIHNWMGNDIAEKMFEVMYASAKPGGYLGVVEHRGNPMVKQDPKAPHGYVNEGYAISLIEKAGWQFVASSEVNNNPLDDKDYEGRVWRLPPTLRYFSREGFPELTGTDRLEKMAIGESDRFTLLFVKPSM